MSAPRAPGSFDLPAYATLAANLADPAGDRAAELRAHGLDEDGWTEVDRLWQERLSRAMDDDGDGVPPLIAAYAEAFERARAAQAGARSVISVERFADAIREIQRRGDPQAALTRLGLTLEQFIRANEHWTRRMLDDASVLERYRRRLGG
jgi:hypothetical protein